MTERIIKRAALVNTEDFYPAAKNVEFSTLDDMLPEAKKISKRVSEYMVAQDVVTDNSCLFVGQLRFNHSVHSDLFHRTGHPHFWKTYDKYYAKSIDSICTFEWQHCVPDFGYVVKHGFAGLKERIEASKKRHSENEEKTVYLEALYEAIDGVIAWAHRCREACIAEAEAETGKRKEELLRISENLSRVPEYPAENFYQALQSVYICYDLLPDSYGLMDRYLYELYIKDINEGKMTREEAKEYLQDLFIRNNSHIPKDSPDFKRGSGGECHFSIGGYLPNGEDGYNELSELILEAVEELPLNCPQISLRYTVKTDKEILRKLMDYERKDPYKKIAFVNDEPRIKALTDISGLSYEDAVSYSTIGCNEIAFPGSIWFGGCTANVARSLVTTLYKNSDAVRKAKSFDEFYSIYEKELNSDLDEIIDYCDFFNEERAKDINVLSALLLDGCIENAESPTRGGCRIKLGGFEAMGLVNVIDSLSVIEQFVYDEKTVTMEKLIDALKANWQGYEELHSLIVKKGCFFGNNYELSDKMSARFCESVYKRFKRRKLKMDISILVGNLSGYNPYFAIFGGETPATPDGRFSGDEFVVGWSQSNGKDREGLIPLLNSIAKADSYGIFCGASVTNITLSEALLKNDDNFEKLVTLFDTYFRLGGLHFQLNCITREELLKAKANPDKYRSLKVRVSGFSGYFVNLYEELQDNIIARTNVDR